MCREVGIVGYSSPACLPWKCMLEWTVHWHITMPRSLCTDGSCKPALEAGGTLFRSWSPPQWHGAGMASTGAGTSVTAAGPLRRFPRSRSNH